MRDAFGTWSTLSRELLRADSVRAAAAVLDRWRPGAAADADRRLQPPRVSPDRVGIWRRTTVTGHGAFVRDASVARPQMWADVDRIEAKHDRRRVVLLGESAARAWPLDPLFTCAGCLEQQLRHAAGGDDIEVVDLARAGVDIGGLLQLAAEAAVLEPDAYVVFAGNNWGLDVAALDFGCMAALARDTGAWGGIAAYIESTYRQQIDDTIDALQRTLRSQGVPIVFVIPAYCLADWQPTPRSCHPLLAGADRERADALRRASRVACQTGHYARAVRTAEELLALEEGLSGAALDVLGRSAQVAGDHVRAARYFEAAWDIGLQLLIPPMSGFSIRVDEMRRRAHDIAEAVVDLPRRLTEANGGAPLDRRVFFGHVHMTAPAIRVAMAHVADQLSPLLRLPACGADALARVPIDVDRRATAQAHLAACLKSGAEDQALELVQYHGAEALRYAPELTPVVADYVERSVHRAADVFCPAFHRLRSAEAQFPVIRHFLNAPPHRVKQRVMRLLLTLVDLVRVEDDDAVAACESALYREHAVDGRAIDFLREPGNDRCGAGLEWTRAYRAYISSHYQDETFHAICGERRPTRLQMTVTWRVRHARAVGRDIVLLVNGAPAAVSRASAEWRTATLDVDGALLVRGLNAFTIRWPDSCESVADRVCAVAGAFEAHQAPAIAVRDLCSVYGEIYDCMLVDESMAEAADRVRLRPALHDVRV